MRRITLSARLPYTRTNAEIAAVVDHELAHYLQFRLNKNASVLRNPLRFNEWKRFSEGFATFFERTRSGFTNRTVTKGVQDVLSGRKLKGETDWYVRGYLRFLAITKANSVEMALQVGLHASVEEWLKIVRLSCQHLGLDFI
jgi:hypothetical protein